LKTNPATKPVRRVVKFKKCRWHGCSDAMLLHAAHECAKQYNAEIVRATMRENDLNMITTCKIVFKCNKEDWVSLVTLFLSVVQGNVQEVFYNT
jgi:hypothetical protein